MMRLQFQHRRTSTSPSGQHAQSLGIRFGYWPCLAALFVTVDLGSHRFDVWFGLQGYES